MESNNCSVCFWKSHRHEDKCFLSRESLPQPQERICEDFQRKCDSCNFSSEAEYKYKGKILCSDCLLSELEVQEETRTLYFQGGEYLGSDDDIQEVVEHTDEWEDGDIERVD